ncbi:MAG TPA: hypothetical protein DEP35_17700 [Deltaproteobacteria bacterium]|nr:hypothetical protein [Deltaproteobacteria bacterium]
MRDRIPSFLLPACAGILACALAAAASARADDLFGPDPEPAPKPPLQCPAGADSGVDLQARIAEIQREISARQGGAPPADGGGVVLNGSGYNYGSGNGYLDQGALNFEAKQAR